MPEDLYTAPGIISSPLSLADRHDWRDSRGKWPLARNPDRGWCHHHTSLKLFGLSPWLHGQQVFIKWSEIICCNWVSHVYVLSNLELNKLGIYSANFKIENYILFVKCASVELQDKYTNYKDNSLYFQKNWKEKYKYNELRKKCIVRVIGVIAIHKTGFTRSYSYSGYCDLYIGTGRHTFCCNLSRRFFLSLRKTECFEKVKFSLFPI